MALKYKKTVYDRIQGDQGTIKGLESKLRSKDFVTFLRISCDYRTGVEMRLAEVD